MKLPINKLKKISSDAHHTVLLHADGHQIKVAHAPLSPKMRAQLASLPALADGGYLEGQDRLPGSGDASNISSTHQNQPTAPSMPAPQPAGTHGDSGYHNDAAIQYNAKRRAAGLPMDAEGGMVKGVHKPMHQTGGVSSAGVKARVASGPANLDKDKQMKAGMTEDAKAGHREVLNEMRSMPKPKLLAQGGEASMKENYSQQCSCPNCDGNCKQKLAEGGVPLPQTADEVTTAQDHGQPGTDLDFSNQPEEVTAQAPQPMDPQSPAPAENEPDQAPDQEQVPQQQMAQAPQPKAAPGADMPEYTEAKSDNPADAFQAAKASHQKEYADEDVKFQQDMVNGHITPKTYGSLFADKSTLGKVGMIFGMLLSGAGSGLTGQPNTLLSMMDKTITNDLDAQRRSKDNAQNFLKLNMQHALNQATMRLQGQTGKLTEAQTKGALIDAEAKTRQMMNRAALHNLVQQTQAIKDPGQRQRAEQQLAMLYGAVNNENYNIGDRAATAKALLDYSSPQGADNGPNSKPDGQNEAQFQSRAKMLRMSGNDNMAKDLEAKHFPGVEGQASGDLSGENRDYLNSGITFHKQLNDFYDWAKNHSGDLNPKDRKEGLAKAADIQGAYRQATKGGVYKEGEQNFISKLIDSTPTKFFNSVRVLPSLKAIQNDTQNRLDQYSKNLGFNGYKGPSQSASAPQAPQYKMVNGVKYMRGPDGKAVKVK